MYAETEGGATAANIIVRWFSGSDDLNRLDDYRQFRPRVEAAYPLLTQVLLYPGINSLFYRGLIFH